MSSLPTGPSGDQFEFFEADMFGYLQGLQQQYRDTVTIDLGGFPTVVLYDLDMIHRVFADKLDHVGRAAVFERLSHATGTGLITNYDWSTWQPRRKRIVRPLGARAVGRFTSV